MDITAKDIADPEDDGNKIKIDESSESPSDHKNAV